MRYIFTILAMFLLWTSKADTPTSNTSVSVVLAELSSTIKSLGSYRAEFILYMGSDVALGHYVVEGDNYYLKLMGAEVYCDGEVRYEVNNENREIIIDKVDVRGYNLLDNPTKSFDFLESEFKSSILVEDENMIVIRLDPTTDSIPFGHLVVTIDRDSKLPKSIVYDMDSDKITINIEDIASTENPPQPFSRRDYKGYEWVDFR